MDWCLISFFLFIALITIPTIIFIVLCISEGIKRRREPESIKVAPKDRPKITYKENPASLYGIERNSTSPNPKLKPQPKINKDFEAFMKEAKPEYERAKAGLREYMTDWQIEQLDKRGLVVRTYNELTKAQQKPKPKKDFVDKVFDGPNDYEPTQASIWKAGIRQESWRLVNLGKLERKDKCENCGQPYPQMHHTSYEDATHIKWLCPACHKAWHREYGWPKAPKKVR